MSDATFRLRLGFACSAVALTRRALDGATGSANVDLAAQCLNEVRDSDAWQRRRAYAPDDPALSAAAGPWAPVPLEDARYLAETYREQARDAMKNAGTEGERAEAYVVATQLEQQAERIERLTEAFAC